jgi:hypothetical protein
MTDQCKGCTLRGDIKECEAVECSNHDNWYVVELKKQIAIIKDENNVLLSVIRHQDRVIEKLEENDCE